MGINTKCQHCWKVFEAVDDAIGTMQPCIFCHKNTRIVPYQEKVEKKVTKVAYASNLQLINLLIFITLIISLFNLVFLINSDHSESTYRDTYIQEVPNWQDLIVRNLKALEEDIQKQKEFLKKYESINYNKEIETKNRLQNAAKDLNNIYLRLQEFQLLMDSSQSKQDNK